MLRSRRFHQLRFHHLRFSSDASVSGSGSGGGAVKASGKSSGSGTKELSRTGGTIPALGRVGALLVGDDLLIRHATR